MITPYLAGVAQPTHTFDATTTDRTVGGLTTGQAYTFKVHATNAVGAGPNSIFSPVATPT